MRRLADELGDRMSPHLVDVLRADWTAEQLTSAVVRRKAVYNAAWRFFRSYDLLLTPTLAVPPFEHGLQGPPVIDGREVDAFYALQPHIRALVEGAGTFARRAGRRHRRGSSGKSSLRADGLGPLRHP